MKITPSDLKDYRTYYGLSQRSLAKVLGISQTYVMLLEKGERLMPDYVADRLGLTFEQLQYIRKAKAERLAMYPQYQK